MCELFGISAAAPFRVNELLDAFYHHSNEHKDGWGLAVFRGHGVSLEKEPVKALSSSYLSQRMTRDVNAANLLAHIRMATIGRIEYANCHPFIWDDESGRSWTMIHNGTIFEGEPIAPYRDLQEGTTDSERILLYLVDRMNQEYAKAGLPLAAEDRFRILDEIVCRLAAGNKLNLLIYDGEILYVHTNCPAGLHIHQSEDRAIFSTKPVLLDGWAPLTQNRLLAFRGGAQVFTGTDHGQTFREEEHDMTPLLSMFAEL